MSNINLDFIERSQPSLFIHFAYQNVTEEMVSRTLNDLDLGNIKEITFKPSVNKKEEHGNSIAIHFDRWFRNPQADKVRHKMISGKSIDINYTAKSYWKVVAFQQKAKPEAPPRAFKKPTITYDDEDDNDFGPKLGVNCSEKYNMPKIKKDEPRREPRPRRDEPRRDEPRSRPRQDDRPRPRDDRPRPRDDRPRPRPRDDDYDRKQYEDDRRQYDKSRLEPRYERKPRLMRPTTPPGPPPHMTSETPAHEEHSVQPVVYVEHNVQPDAFDLSNGNSYKGIMLPQPKKKFTLLSDSEDEDSDLEEGEDKIEDEISKALYGDL
jgi:hypothetical protein